MYKCMFYVCDCDNTQVVVFVPSQTENSHYIVCTWVTPAVGVVMKLRTWNIMYTLILMGWLLSSCLKITQWNLRALVPWEDVKTGQDMWIKSQSIKHVYESNIFIPFWSNLHCVFIRNRYVYFHYWMAWKTLEYRHQIPSLSSHIYEHLRGSILCFCLQS